MAPYASRNATVSQVWKQVRRLADIEDVLIHDLRHTLASYAVMAGYPLPVISKLLGHQRLSSTLRYTHVSNTHVEQGAEQVGQALTKIVSAAKKERKRTKIKPAKKRDEILTSEQIKKLLHEVDFLDNF
nr:tyrosine-type recombinase/integrase [Vibrio brasiliensis]